MAKLPRLPLTARHRRALAEARVGVPKSEAHRKALSESQKGRVLTEEHRRKISEGLRARSDEKVLEECRKVTKARWKWMADTRVKQWKADQMLAIRLGHSKALLRDIKQSGGWSRKRRIKRFPGITDGFSGAELRAAYAASYGGKKAGYRG